MIPCIKSLRWHLSFSSHKESYYKFTNVGIACFQLSSHKFVLSFPHLRFVPVFAFGRIMWAADVDVSKYPLYKMGAHGVRSHQTLCNKFAKNPAKVFKEYLKLSYKSVSLTYVVRTKVLKINVKNRNCRSCLLLLQTKVHAVACSYLTYTRNFV